MKWSTSKIQSSIPGANYSIPVRLVFYLINLKRKIKGEVIHDFNPNLLKRMKCYVMHC